MLSRAKPEQLVAAHAIVGCFQAVPAIPTDLSPDSNTQVIREEQHLHARSSGPPRSAQHEAGRQGTFPCSAVALCVERGRLAARARPCSKVRQASESLCEQQPLAAK